ncbi:MAG: DNA-binding protein [Candidatus Pacebacteria bacterium]|nr:DNA-binding protein [Candidatus Paceibacterota bacterium]
MQYQRVEQGRVWVVRLETGEVLHEQIEAIARREEIQAAVCFALGGAAGKSRIVTGPENPDISEIVPQVLELQNVHETVAVGTIFPDETGAPVVHMHGVFGRGEEAHAGCVRTGVITWLVNEIVILELTHCTAYRKRDADSGLELLAIDE